jgi:FkbM family methyltransferase
MSFILPNGLSVEHVNVGETLALYREIFEDKVYLGRGLAISEGAVVLDVGANIGLFTLFALETCPSAFVHAFEPAPAIFDLLERNVRCYDRIALNKCGVRAETGQAALTFLPHCTAFSGYDHHAVVERLSALARARWANVSKRWPSVRLMEHDLAAFWTSERISTPVRSLSSYIAERAIDRINLLKIDVEGDERAVLAGIDPAHWERIRQIALEVHEAASLSEIASILSARGHVVDIVPKGGSTHMIYGRLSA